MQTIFETLSKSRETVLVCLLFIGYLALWTGKRRAQRRETGLDPAVMGKSSSPLQRYFNGLMRFLTIYAVLVIILHGAGVQFRSLLVRLELTDSALFDYLGFSLGLCGLTLCGFAQRWMGASWRVGIDEKNTAPLVRSGLFAWIRNPTYTGLFLLYAGLWIIWPTWMVGIFCIIFFFFIEVQVRCEEEYLERVHGEEYLGYKQKTRRYFPFVY